jgi:hypothetical protein
MQDVGTLMGGFTQDDGIHGYDRAHFRFVNAHAC